MIVLIFLFFLLSPLFFATHSHPLCAQFFGNPSRPTLVLPIVVAVVAAVALTHKLINCINCWAIISRCCQRNIARRQVSPGVRARRAAAGVKECELVAFKNAIYRKAYTGITVYICMCQTDRFDFLLHTTMYLCMCVFPAFPTFFTHSPRQLTLQPWLTANDIIKPWVR